MNVSIWSARAREVRLADGFDGLAEPPRSGRQAEAEARDVGADLFADVQAVGELAAKDAQVRAPRVHVDRVLAGELRPVGVCGLTPARSADRERPHTAALGDDVRLGQRLR